MIKKIILKGRVQGVGCRGYCGRYARKYLIKGSATNISDGTVRLILNINDELVLQRFIASLISNPDGLMFYGTIDDISISDHMGKTDGDYNF